MLARRFVAVATTLSLLTAGGASAAGRPDLVEVSVSQPPLEVGAGTGFTLKDQVKNKGGARSPASTTRYYLSADRVRDAGDLRLGGRSVPGLRPGRSSKGSRLVTVPSDVALDSYYILTCADDKKVVREDNERNNCRSSANRAQIRAPTCRERLNLLGVDFTVGPETIGIQDPVTVHPPIAGVSFTNASQILNADMNMDCQLALRLDRLAHELVPLGIDGVEQIGIYNYRCNVGTGTPPDCPSGISQHAYGMAIDFASFSGTGTYDVEEDWTPQLTGDTCEQATTSPEHLFLRDLACSWDESNLFNIILTPNYNAAHSNHIHVDLTPDADFID